MRILVTGVAGFIGYHLAQEFLSKGHEVVGIDNLNDYYSPDLKQLRLNALKEIHGFSFIHVDISDQKLVNQLVSQILPDYIYHLAAQAGVRLPIKSYGRYVDSNLTGFANVAIAAAQHNISNLLYASSSSVYGDSTLLPYTESEKGLVQVSFYGATKYTNEILAKSLSISSQTRFRGLRFFTVYGSMGRPDMAYFRLIHSALNRKPFHLFGDGTLRRDFTYISDVITSITLLGIELNTKKSGYSDVVNVGGGKPNSMIELINCINLVSKTEIVVVNEIPAKGDVHETIADHNLQVELTGFVPKITLEEGIEKVYAWASKPDIRSKIEKWIE